MRLLPVPGGSRCCWSPVGAGGREAAVAYRCVRPSLAETSAGVWGNGSSQEPGRFPGFREGPVWGIPGVWEKPVASLTCLRPSLLPRRLRPRRRGRTCRERQRERRINRAGVAPAGVSAPPRLTWLRLALKRRGERRLAHGPTRTPLSPVGIHTPT